MESTRGKYKIYFLWLTIYISEFLNFQKEPSRVKNCVWQCRKIVKKKNLREYKIVQTLMHNNLRSIVSRFKLISLLCMIYVYAMRLQLYVSIDVIFQCLLRQKSVPYYMGLLWQIALEYMNTYDEHLTRQ